MPESKSKRQQSRRYRARALYALVTGAGFTTIGALLTAFQINTIDGLVFVSISILSILGLFYYTAINVLKIEDEEKEEDQEKQAEAIEEATYRGMIRAFKEAGIIETDEIDFASLKNPDLIEEELEQNSETTLPASDDETQSSSSL